MVLARTKKKEMGLQKQNNREGASTPETLPEAEVVTNTSISLFLPQTLTKDQTWLGAS